MGGSTVSPPGSFEPEDEGCQTMKTQNVLLLVLVLGLACEPTSFVGFRVGVDRIQDEPYASWIRGRRVGLITNQTGVTSTLVPTAEILRRMPEVRLTALFGPEHGIAGSFEAGDEVTDAVNYFNLYGETRAPTPEMLRNVDVLVYDIQDAGVRFYTFISTMFESMKAAAENGIPFLVLDRPNPIDASRVEGPVLEQGFESFVGVHPIPIRYGMTPGELAMLFKEEAGLDLVLWVVPLEGWRRTIWYDQLRIEWIAPSPNMPTVRTAEVYPGTCLIEGTNLSEGRGTTRPFELIGAPWLDAETLATLLNHLQLPGVTLRVQPFRPTFSKYSGEMCNGVQVHVTDRRAFRPVDTTIHLIREALNLHPDKLQFREEAFDRLVGNNWVRRMLVESRAADAIIDRWQPELESFNERRRKNLLY